MERFMASLARGSLQAIVGKLTALLGEEYERFNLASGKIEPLVHELSALEALLIEKLKVEDPGEEDKLWIKHVRELSYDIEDSLDVFMVHAADNSANPDGFMKKIRSLLKKSKRHHWTAQEIEDLKKNVTRVAERNQRYGVGDQPVANANNASIDRRALALFEDASKLVGIDGPNGKLISLLEKDRTEDGSVQQQTRVVWMVGPGGIGKSTLAHHVYQNLEGRYNHRAFLSISRNPDIKGILRTILYEVVRQEDFEAVIEGDYVSRVAGEDQLITKIREYLTGKRYFIVLDDIWDVKTWNSIKDIFPMTSCGSKIITTTRINDVAQDCCRSSTNGDIYNMKPLSLADSTQLFYRRLFNPEEKCPSHLEEIAGEILEKSASLPLAIIAISGLPSSEEKTKEQWDQVINLMGRELERNSSHKVLKILSLSYVDLPRHLKSCLLYLSIFPEDDTIGKENLIRRWIGEGFIHEQSAAYDSAEMYFNDLINRGLIQPGGRDEFCEVNSCKRNPDVKGILRTILYEVVRQEDFEAVIEGDYVSRVAAEDQLITKIREYLRGKRYFIVLDDIRDMKTWNSIKDIFPMASRGSKIITASRIYDVAQDCCRSSTNGDVYNMTPLSMADSTQLFYRRLFNPEEKAVSDWSYVPKKSTQGRKSLRPLGICASVDKLLVRLFEALTSLEGLLRTHKPDLYHTPPRLLARLFEALAPLKGLLRTHQPDLQPAPARIPGGVNCSAITSAKEGAYRNIGSCMTDAPKCLSYPDSGCGNHDIKAVKAKTSAWVVATAAPHHATGNRSLLSGFITEHDVQFVHSVNGVPMPVCARGSVVTDAVVLPNVWFIPGLTSNLVSVSQLSELDYSVGFGRGTCYIRSAGDGKIIGKACMREGQYVLDFLKVPLAM